MRAAHPPGVDSEGGRTIRQIASTQHVVSNKKVLPQGKTSVQSLSTRKLMPSYSYARDFAVQVKAINSKQLVLSVTILKH